jgi:putative drug exporter of the RND superfamily
LLSRLGPWCHDRRRFVLGLWIALLVLGNAVAGGVGDAYRQDFSLDGFESTDGLSLVQEAFPDGSGTPQTAQIVFRVDQGVDVAGGLGGRFVQDAPRPASEARGLDRAREGRTQRMLTPGGDRWRAA